MATGAFVSTGYNDWFPVAGLSVNAPVGVPFTSGARGLMDPVPALKSGALTISLPTDPSTYADAPAGKVASYFDDFYNRIYITPPSIDFGAITADTQASVNIWNAYLGETVVLTSVNYNLDADIGVTGATPPAQFLPLATRTYNITASTQGPAALDEIVSWFFDVPWAYGLHVTGNRSKAWVFEPNWGGDNYTISYEFKTEILTSRAGKDQRIAQRTSPRKSVSYQTQLKGDTFRQYKDLMWAWQNKSFTMPELTRFATSSATMTSGSSSMVLEVMPLWIVPGAAVLLGYLGYFENRVVDTVVGTTVTFRTNGTAVWPAGSRVYPALSGFVAQDMSAPRLTNSVAVLSLVFNVTPLSELWITPPAAPATFNGREAFLKKPNWAEEVAIASGHPVDELDYGRGPVFRYTAIPFGYNTKRATYLNRTRAEAEDIYWFFCRMKGQQGEFYMPTWEYDFVPKVAAPAGSAAIRVAGTTFADTYADSTVHKAMFVLMNDGTLLMRKVVNITKVSDVGGNDSVITVDSVWPSSISDQTIVMCGWMPLWRLASDILQMEWLTNAVAQTQITMLTLEDLPVETP